MMFSKQRHATAQAVENAYLDLHHTGAAILDGARYAHAVINDQCQHHPSLVNHCASFAAKLAEFTVHAGLFLIWAPANTARIAATRILTPGATNAN